VQQLAADIGELREGARQLLLAIAQLEAVKLRQPEACSALLAKLSLILEVVILSIRILIWLKSRGSI
jgi:hypothetical protein